MGIDKNRFESNMEIFMCGICRDVAADPILINICEHFLCRSCVPSTKVINHCPTCGSQFVGCHEMTLALQRVYDNIKLRCANISCEEELTIKGNAEHEKICPHGNYKCPQLCGFKINIQMEDEIRLHNCIHYLLEQTDRLNGKVIFLERVNDNLENENDELKRNVQELQTKVNVVQANDIDNKRRRARCGIILQRGENFYRCFTCQVRRISVICVECFQNGNHTDHRFALMNSEIDGFYYCDCGDPYTLKGEACFNHQLKSIE